ncbi:MAG: hypothetical protein HOI95_07990 [Chromatiales bacterium]|jgi:hypothetical protein|nr:hypothetical protein [Chromatiales bacterium]
MDRGGASRLVGGSTVAELAVFQIVMKVHGQAVQVLEIHPQVHVLDTQIAGGAAGHNVEAEMVDRGAARERHSESSRQIA